jgi:hypothetical protein
MGLDMYLYARQFVSLSSWAGEKESSKVKEVANMMNGNNFLMEDSLQFAEIKLQVAYWRKANAIHKYFVDQCANGKDECQDTYVEREQLQDLLNRCKTILEDHSKAGELLPTRSGFFFGSTDYDEWYFYDLEQTVPVLEKILKESPRDWEFEYQASW